MSGGGMWRPAGHCGAKVPSCPGNCACRAAVRAEMGVEAARNRPESAAGVEMAPESHRTCVRNSEGGV